jgi:pimeloyl-ACP methyl ester carboxylesterase
MGHAGKAGVGELELSWDSFGDPDDPALVLVMGLGADRGYWRDPFCEAIAALGRRVIRFDNRDVGESTRLNHLDVPNAAKLILARRFGRTTNVPYHLEDMADDVVGLLDALNIERADLVGASMGGMIVQEAAIRSPGRVRSLTSIMSTTGSTRVPWPRLRGLIWLARPSPLELEARVKHFKRLRIYIEGGYYVPDDADREAQCRIDIARMGFDARGSARQFAAVAMQRDRTEDLRQLDVPTLVVHGRRDPLVRPKCGQATADAIPGARLAWFEHMGHVIAPELYEPIADAIRDNARRGE